MEGDETRRERDALSTSTATQTSPPPYPAAPYPRRQRHPLPALTREWTGAAGWPWRAMRRGGARIRPPLSSPPPQMQAALSDGSETKKEAFVVHEFLLGPKLCTQAIGVFLTWWFSLVSTASLLASSSVHDL